MPTTDPIADFLTHLRNAQQARHKFTEMPVSKVKAGMAQILKDQGYIQDFFVMDSSPSKTLHVDLKYLTEKEGIFHSLRRISKPGRRVYCGADKLPRVRGGMGIAIISTSKGLMTDHQARKEGVGGEILCEIW
jgi:small subunit ribosomal protein S8